MRRAPEPLQVSELRSEMSRAEGMRDGLEYREEQAERKRMMMRSTNRFNHYAQPPESSPQDTLSDLIYHLSPSDIRKDAYAHPNPNMSDLFMGQPGAGLAAPQQASNPASSMDTRQRLQPPPRSTPVKKVPSKAIPLEDAETRKVKAERGAFMRDLLFSTLIDE
mmetsp:Transcript_8738/g.13864  ORF Transcript_8738/g.13864 Transcript_8738/m.13864 type:complete len:164 (+) Transcript_8738:341-832(+)